MTRAYPDKNPFPYQGAMTIGASSEPESDESYHIERTLELDPVRKLLKHLKGYLGRIKSNESSKGYFVALRGDHGCGKTHALKYGMDWIKGQYQNAGSDSLNPVQLYAQATKPDFPAVYRQLASQISIDELKDLSIRFLGVVASEQIGKTSEDQSVKEEIASKLQENPSKLFELFRNYLVEEGAVHERQREEVKSLSVEGGDNFRRAFSYVLSPELGRSAYNWIVGQSISVDDARRLGVTGPITTGEACMIALQLLAALFNRIKRPFLVFVDQYEKLVLAEDKTLAAGNAGLLHSLLQSIPNANGLFVIAGNEEAWDALPRDLKSRFAGNIVDFPMLKPEESCEIIRLYLTPANEEFVPNSSNGDAQSDDVYYPFATDAAKSIVTYSGGNLRKLLQISSKAFEAAAPKRQVITTRIVDQVLAESNLTYHSSESILDDIERVVNQHSLKYEREWRVANVKADLVVLDAENQPIVLFEINEATFHEQEAQRALEVIGRVQRIRQQGISAPIVFIALGYVSEQVTKTVREFAQDFLVYKPETFADEVGRILARFKESSAPSADSSKYIETLEEKLRDLSARLEDVLKDRQAESEIVDKRLADFFERQSVDRLNEKRQAARPAWAEERRHIEKEIQDARRQRAQNELIEMERLRERAEADRKRRAWLQALSIWLFVLGILIYGTVMRMRLYSYPLLESLDRTLRFDFVGLLIVAAFLISLLLILRSRNIMGPTIFRELAAPVSSRQELERLSRQYLVMFEEPRSLLNAYRDFLISLINPFPARARRLLRDANPHYRFTGVLGPLPDWYTPRLVKILKAERSSIVRRAIARRLDWTKLSAEDKKDLSSGSVVELAYMIENTPQMAQEDLSMLSPRLHILASIYYGTWLSDHSAAAQLAARRGPFYDAYNFGLDRLDFRYNDYFRESDVRSAIAELSPLDEGGLGTLDELKKIGQIDDYYLFCRQLLFFMERDLLPSPRDS